MVQSLHFRILKFPLIQWSFKIAPPHSREGEIRLRRPGHCWSLLVTVMSFLATRNIRIYQVYLTPTWRFPTSHGGTTFVSHPFVDGKILPGTDAILGMGISLANWKSPRLERANKDQDKRCNWMMGILPVCLCCKHTCIYNYIYIYYIPIYICICSCVHIHM